MTRRPRILEPPRRPKVFHDSGTALSDHPVSFTAVDAAGVVLAQASLARSELGRLINMAKACELYTLAMVGLHGVTRLESKQAKRIEKELHALEEAGEVLDPAWVRVFNTAAGAPTITLVVTAGM